MIIPDWFPEFNASAENDYNLDSYFYDNGIMEKILKKNKWLVLGRKGTGKTALYKHTKDSLIKKNVDLKLIIPFNFSSYPWPIHNLFKEENENNLNSFRKSWKFLFYTQIYSNLIAKKERNKEKLTSNLKFVREVFDSIYGKPDFSVNETLKSKLLRIKKLNLPGVDLESLSWTLSLGAIEFDDDIRNENIQRLRNNVFSLLDFLEKNLKNELKNEKIIILMDNLDEDWLIDNIEKSKLLIINLLSAINEINFKYDNVNIIAFLRTDIFDELRFNDKNKFYQDTIVEITWTKKELKEMIFSRIIRFSPNNFFEKPDDDFDKCFNYKRTRYNSLPSDYILKQTFYRPRDFLIFLNIIRKNSKKNSIVPKYFNPKDIYDSENEYSSFLYKEIIDEWCNQKPEITDYLDVIQSIGKTKFLFSHFLIALTQHFAFKEVNENITKSIVIEILKFLFSISIIGQEFKGKLIFNVDKPYHQIKIDKEFVVNYGLHKRLSL